ncbi:oxidoreductase [Gordoniibacillus kamchatkensis]|uniref:Oxidoreductase n=1 Tax=Gordoniibacillus kamchatkensis TaxID=1590651 RepID=A0ABR5AGD9_9BACL|nr:aldo/keto reductase [Paenibacillus sp. VKM B-2647]KIL39893.1 oxidoreductase [Paenibacillus sp. VKM B-2647]
MKRNRLGQSDLYVTEIGLGCMSLGTDERTAVRIVHEALERGVNLFDTADLYDGGLNEELVGKALRGRRSDAIIATKVGNRRVPGQAGWVWDPSKAYIKEAVKESLRRLQTDYIDLYQLHGGTIEDPVDETIEAFEELQREGVIRSYGISSIRPNVIREYAARSRIVSVMSQYSLLDRRPEEQVLPLLAERGIGLIARGSVAKGLLSGQGSRKVTDEGYLDYSRDELTEVIRTLNEASAAGSLTTTAIRYALAHPAVAAAIPGASSTEQLIRNLEAGAVPPLTEEAAAKLRSLTKANTYAVHR